MANKFSEVEENKIPVFTVLKNNSILKNIFIVNQPPPSICAPKLNQSDKNVETPVQEYDETLLVGRHPECNIVLEHPSISRFHFRIHSKPTTQELSVIDLSSVHGTWISGKKIEPGAPVELSEGDTIRIGSSSRLYRLHWVPLSCAYDLEKPFVPDLLIEEKKEDERTVNEDGKKDETFQSEKSFSVGSQEIVASNASTAYGVKKNETLQDENFFCVGNKQIIASNIIPEAMESMFPDENSEPFGKQLTPSAPPMPETTSPFSFPDEPERGPPKAELFEELENQESSRNDREISSLWFGPYVPEPVWATLSDLGNQQFDKENHYPQCPIITELPSQGENNENSAIRVDQEADLQNYLKSSLCEEEKEAQQQDLSKGREHKSGPQATESVNKSLPGEIVISDIKNPDFVKENRNVNSVSTMEGLSESNNLVLESPPTKSESKSILPCIWERRGKPASILRLQTGAKNTVVGVSPQAESWKEGDTENKSSPKALFNASKGEEEPFTPNKENFTPNTYLLKSMKRMGMLEEPKHSKAVFHASEGEEELFTPNKENFTPNTLLLKSMKRIGMLEEPKHCKSYKSSPLKATVSASTRLEEDTFASPDKENQTPKVLEEQKSARPTSGSRGAKKPAVLKKVVERVPFQPLLKNAPTCESKSEASVPSATSRSCNSVNRSKNNDRISNPTYNCIRERSWNLAVDSTCLLNKESRKSLQLLQGVHGTQLIIPRIVIRELDCLKRRGSLFRRITEAASALQWIEECMVTTTWWIHVQRSEEEGRPIAPTPPASPQSLLNDAGGGFVGGTSPTPFSARGSLMDIVSPTADDHILEYALLFKRIKNNEQLVILSHDVTLKIKAMAEGLICETAEEFRESLVNPFSERFLWADSSPRGLTWSCSDDVVLKEKYNRGTLRRPSKGSEAAKGLKLILLHNSQYGHQFI